MPSVLVVDDSPSDRHLVGEFLSADSSLELRFAADGAEALSQIESTAPDLVVTDILMPRIDGLELVSQLKARTPALPVVLMTSTGSEETASKALNLGAASYVPKASLQRDLLATVRSLLDLTVERRIQCRLLNCMTQDTSHFVLDTDRSLIPSLIHYLQDAATRMGWCDPTDRMRMGIALEEALVNALLHGNLEVSSDLRNCDPGAYDSLVESRRAAKPYQDRLIFVESRLTRDSATFRVRDEGPGFDPESLPDPTDPANLEKASGRGVLLMRTFMDSVVFNRQGNEVTLTKNRAPTDASRNGS